MCRTRIVSDRESTPLSVQPARVSRPSISRFIAPLGSLPVVVAVLPEVLSSTVDVVWMLSVSWPRKYLTETIPPTLAMVSTSPAAVSSLVHSGDLGLRGPAFGDMRRLLHLTRARFG